VYVSLTRCASLNSDPYDLVETGCEGANGTDSAKGIAAALRSELGSAGRVWLFLDGLDEVAPSQVAGLLVKLAIWSSTGARIAVFSRQSVSSPSERSSGVLRLESSLARASSNCSRTGYRKNAPTRCASDSLNGPRWLLSPGIHCF
jgi:hypothetical protein